MVFKYGLKAQKLLAQGIASKQYALKGQKLLAQGVWVISIVQEGVLGN